MLGGQCSMLGGRLDMGIERLKVSHLAQKSKAKSSCEDCRVEV